MKRYPSPSAQLSYLVCPGYTPEEDSGIDATRGQLLHEACETEQPHLAENNHDRHQVELSLRHRDMVLEQLKNTNPKVWGQGHVSRTEVQLKSNEEHGGTVDYLALPKQSMPTEAVVIDYKFGYLPVPPAEENPQGVAYANRVFELCPTVQFVHVHFIIPALRAATKATFSREEAAAFTQAIRNELDDPKRSEELHPGHACKYCANRGVCQAIATPVVATLQQEHRINFPTSWEITDKTSPETLSAYRSIAGLMETFCKDAKKAVDGEVSSRNIDLPGYRWIRRAEDFYILESRGVASVLFENASPPVKALVPLLFSETKDPLRKFASRLFLLFSLEGKSDVPFEDQDWVAKSEDALLAGALPDTLIPESLKDHYPMFQKLAQSKLKKQPGSAYLAKTPRKGYLEMLQEVVDYDLFEELTDTSTDVTDPNELVEDVEENTTSHTDNTAYTDHTDAPEINSNTST